jgi:SNF2 family DNA or RNA helicase
MLFFNFKQGMKMVKEHKETFYQQVIKPLSKDFELVFDKGVYRHNKIELDYKKEQIYISEKDDYIIIKPQVVYDNNVSVLLMHNGNYIKKDDSGSINEYVRNTELESVFLEQIAALHPDFQDQKANNFFYLHIDKFTKDLWFYKFFDKLNAADVEIFGLKELKKLKYSPYKGKVSFGIRSGQDWFDVSINVSFGNNKVSLSDIKKAVVNQQKYIQLKDGSVGILPEEWLHKFEKYFRNGNVQKNELRISKLRFSIIDELFDNIDDEKLLKELAQKKKRISNFTQISKTKVPDEIKAELRPYQKEGLNWLNFLDEMKWGGILADDMGLGKTLQILTFIQHISKSDKTPNLIVIPTTLLFNWKAEIEKFAPKIKSYFHYGIDRQKDTKNFKAKNIIFTSYGIMMRDIEYLKDFLFNYVILDESQAIKNPTSRRYKAANLLQAKNKIAMTGTPIENSTFDLFAQMNFVNPGIFGSIKSFKENYSNPIDKEGNEMVANELQKVIHPFVLRRTKENVAKELPPKVEDIIYCEMEPAQRQVYDAYRNTYRNKLLKQVEEKGIGQSKMMVLEALTRLRQICDSPALIDEVDYDEKSIKIKEIVEHIIHKTAKHKVLIFSQFVKMLGLIKEELIRLNIPFEYLDGKSSFSQREQSVNSFQNDPNLRVFLISLRAGGTGLNLTAADYVYIMDPWWNPAVENQAIDRTYRIGQDKSVFAYRMICKNTVEEKILDLQAKKIKIATDIIHTDENIMKNLSVTDINDLFG